MNATDLRDIIKGLLVVISISLALGQYPKLQRFARLEAAKALKGGHTPRFFPNGYDSMHDTARKK